ncbi:helix-turn-helix transcriptional regulator [Terriglobus roseus]|uniref:helix-turn-helix transcriptional regulator n=1 Tax=Terriglobus roseus TaxID=392734 RepID=UPI001560D35D|nr:WYL domain-containing protein [Terriglobus roseus]
MEIKQRTPARWGQERRLEFIEFRLQWEGRVNRGDLVDFFGISIPQASVDFARYRELAPENATYDVLERAYIASKSFSPVLLKVSPDDYLTRLWAVSSGVEAENSSFLGWKPETGLVADQARPVDGEILRTILAATRDRKIVRIKYQSVSSSSISCRNISPHALGFNGSRWHARAFCHERNAFRDFVLGRVREALIQGTSPIDPASDSDWHNMIAAVIVPHPKLSDDQRQIIEADYCMTDGKLILQVQEAMLFYNLEHLGLLNDTQNLRKGLALANRSELKSFYRKHGLLD